MGSLVYVELLDKSKYRKFLHQALPWIGHAGIIHFFRSSLIHAAKNDGSEFVESRATIQGLEAGSSKTATAHALVRLNSSSVLPSDSTRPLIYNDIASDASDPDYGGSPIRRCAFSCRSKTL